MEEYMKKNYQSLFNRCIYIDNEGELSNSFLTLAKKQKHLTFDRRYLDPKFRQVTETPFKEIRPYDNFISMLFEHGYKFHFITISNKSIYTNNPIRSIYKIFTNFLYISTF